ncbi:MAG: ferredoxin family protein [Chloroflexi bacterium]|nr:ferredoxin family protein [Chloroflexota bacterium]
MGVERINYEACTSCGKCYDMCPMDVYERAGRTYYIAHSKDCMTCFLCEIDCPKDAIYVGPERGRPVVLPY